MNTPCILWTGARDKKGYGRLSKGKLAHRRAWELKNGPAGSLCVCHKCDTPACVNTDHLFLGTRADNTADMISKGRFKKCYAQARGERQHLAKLTAEKVRDARFLAKSGWTSRRLALLYGVHQVTIAAAVRGATWAHVT